jgi:ribonuclease HII
MRLEIVCGVDEAGRGPLAGPVVAAAVILDAARPIRGLADSKVLTREQREDLRAAILEACEVGVGVASVGEIDSLNILQASLLAMQRAVAALPRPPCRALVDGNRLPPLPCLAEAIVGGDACMPAISAASIIAKTHRDAVMYELAARYPGYGWETNVGYSTREHFAALARLGPTPEHRRSFAPVKALLSL